MFAGTCVRFLEGGHEGVLTLQHSHTARCMQRAAYSVVFRAICPPRMHQELEPAAALQTAHILHLQYRVEPFNRKPPPDY